MRFLLLVFALVLFQLTLLSLSTAVPLLGRATGPLGSMEKQVGTAQAASAYAVQEQEPPKSQAPTPQAGAATPASPASQGNQAPAQAAAAAKGDAGYIEPAQLKALLHKIWLAEYRTNDLLTEVHPERWKISNDARKSFNQTLENLRKALASQEDWRAQFEKRPDSAYVGYETFVAISAVLPRLDALARGVSQYENRSLGAQYSQAENQLFDLQQALQAPLEYMVRNQDQLLLAAQTNLASCQSQLGFAMRPRTESATPIKTYIPEIKGHGRVFYTGETYPGSNTPPQAAPRPTGEKKAQKKTEKKPEAKQAAEKKAGEKRKPSAAGEAKAATPPEKPKK